MIKWIYNSSYINSYKIMFYTYIISMLIMILITIFLVIKSLKENKDVNK